MSRPLSSFKPKGGVITGNTGDFGELAARASLNIANAHSYPIELRPQFPALAMRVIAAGATLDSYVTRILVAMVGGNTDVVIAMYNSLGSTITQHTTLRAAAGEVLPTRMREVLSALLVRYKEVMRNRHRIAHHLWGTSADVPNGVVILDPKDLERVIGSDAHQTKWDQIPVFFEEDFNEWVTQIEELSLMFHDFYFMVGPHRHRADSILHSLEAAPHLAKLLRKAAGKTEEEPTQQPSTPPPTEAAKK